MTRIRRPMGSSTSRRLEELLGQIGSFLREEIVPRERSWIARGFHAAEPELQALRRTVKQLGLWAPQLSTALGGMGLPLTEYAHVSEALGRSPFGHFVFGAQAPDAGNIEILAQHGTSEQKERYLAPLARGDIRSCYSMTEPDCPGSNPTQLECRAVKDGDSYVIDGKKWFTTGAEGAAFAIVMAVTHPDAEPHLRASQIIVPVDAPGFVRVRNISVMGEPGEGYSSHAEVHYRSCRVPVSSLLGEEGKGFLIAQERLGPGRIHHCMRWIGICERAFDLMCARAMSRKIDGERTLATQQIVQIWIAESRAQIHAARLMVLDAAHKIDAHGFQASQEEVSLIKFFVADVMMRVIDHAIQVHGALGISDDTILAYFYRHERGARIYDGPDEVHKIAAARRIMRRYQEASGETDGRTSPPRA